MGEAKLKKPNNPKERSLVKGAIRRVFSRSEERRNAIASATIFFQDINRPRVTRWVVCSNCGQIFPAYQAEVDHKEPVVPLNKSLDDMSWDELVSRLWCESDNLAVLDKDCHKEKSKAETKERKRIKNEKS